MIRHRPCPSCAKPHGHTAWAAANSSIGKPLRCKLCERNFHQSGLHAFFFGTLLVPVGVVAVLFTWLLSMALPAVSSSVTFWLSTLAAAFLCAYLLTAFVSWRYPLVIGPKFG